MYVCMYVCISSRLRPGCPQGASLFPTQERCSCSLVVTPRRIKHRHGLHSLASDLAVLGCPKPKVCRPLQCRKGLPTVNLTSSLIDPIEDATDSAEDLSDLAQSEGSARTLDTEQGLLYDAKVQLLMLWRTKLHQQLVEAKDLAALDGQHQPGREQPTTVGGVPGRHGSTSHHSGGCIPAQCFGAPAPHDTGRWQSQ